MKIRHKVLKPWPFPKKTKAITIYPWIFYREEFPDIETMDHEMEHVAQVRREIRKARKKHLPKFFGWLKFYGSYIAHWKNDGYWQNKYEQKAREAEDE